MCYVWMRSPSRHQSNHSCTHRDKPSTPVTFWNSSFTIISLLSNRWQSAFASYDKHPWETRCESRGLGLRRSGECAVAWCFVKRAENYRMCIIVLIVFIWIDSAIAAQYTRHNRCIAGAVHWLCNAWWKVIRSNGSWSVKVFRTT